MVGRTFIVDLACCFDQVLEMGAGEEVAEIDKLAVSLVLDVDGTPSVLTGWYRAAGQWSVVFLAVSSMVFTR